MTAPGAAIALSGGLLAAVMLALTARSTWIASAHPPDRQLEIPRQVVHGC